MAAKLTAEERVRIVGLLREGKSQGFVSKKVERSKDTVGRIGREAGIESDGRNTKKATEAAATMREIDRMEIIGLGLNTGVELLRGYRGRDATIENVRAYKDLMTGLAIGIDKHRLETGEATSRTENVDPERRRKMKESLDEVAAQRRKSLAG